ncbi:MAG: creatininase family protein [Candidatus Thorarchaeota archaeon]|jgi:creatinine amidohydrolase/Fe(II)-dependent formamide hydrolase-like protein
METSVAWHVGQRVVEDKLIDEPGRSIVKGFIEPNMASTAPRVGTAYSMKDLSDSTAPRVGTAYSMKDLSDSGVVGYATKATKEKGSKVVATAIERIGAFIREINP